jgi:hypothetical protein
VGTLSAAWHGIGAISYSWDNWAFHANSSTSVGVAAYSRDDVAVRGWTDSGRIGVEGENNRNGGVGVRGHSDKGIGVKAESENGTALRVEGIGYCRAEVNKGDMPYAFHVENPAQPLANGQAPCALVGTSEGYGVHGRTGAGVGIRGAADSGTAVDGTSWSGTGVFAKSYTGTALKVEGIAQCSADVVAKDQYDFPPSFHVFNEGTAYDPSSGWHPPVALAGYSPKGFAVHGSGMTGVVGVSDLSNGTGVSGWCEKGVGVHAASEKGTALKVEGTGVMTANVSSGPALAVDNQGGADAIRATSKQGPTIIAISAESVGLVGSSMAE